MEEIPFINMPVQRLNLAVLPLDSPCSGLVTHSGEILTTSRSRGKKPDIHTYIIYTYINKQFLINKSLIVKLV